MGFLRNCLISVIALLVGFHVAEHQALSIFPPWIRWGFALVAAGLVGAADAMLSEPRRSRG